MFVVWERRQETDAARRGRRRRRARDIKFTLSWRHRREPVSFYFLSPLLFFSVLLFFLVLYLSLAFYLYLSFFLSFPRLSLSPHSNKLLSYLSSYSSYDVDNELPSSTPCLLLFLNGEEGCRFLSSSFPSSLPLSPQDRFVFAFSCGC